MTGALDSGGQGSLMTGAGTGHTAGKNLSALGSILAELCNILIVDGIDLVDAKAANLSAALAVSAHGALGALGALGTLGLCLGGSGSFGGFRNRSLYDILVFHFYSVLTL